jgi:hypothetical protein
MTYTVIGVYDSDEIYPDRAVRYVYHFDTDQWEQELNIRLPRFAAAERCGDAAQPTQSP